jgi:hypothetical protein
VSEKSTEEQVREVLENLDRPEDAAGEEPLAAETAPDRTRQFTHVNFSRMRTGWQGDDAETVQVINAVALDIVRKRLPVAFALMNQVYKAVRQPETDGDGVVLVNPDGSPRWVLDEGVPVEHWEDLGDRERRRFLGIIVSHMFEWELAAAELWGNAMYAKGIWEEMFADGFTAIPAGVVSGKPTIDDRTQWGHKNAARDRYFALFRSGISRRAEGILKAMKGLEYHLRETLPS